MKVYIPYLKSEAEMIFAGIKSDCLTEVNLLNGKTRLLQVLILNISHRIGLPPELIQF
jgi:hypothetical protein